MTNTKAFRQAFDQTVPHMGELGSGLDRLFLESDGTHLFVVATDRYTIAVSRLLVENTIPWKAILGTGSVKKLQATINVLGNEVAFRHYEDTGVLHLGSNDTAIGLAAVAPDMRMSGGDEDGFFDWRRIIRRQLERPPADLAAEMTVKFLARWPHLSEKATFWYAGEKHPVMVISEDFIGGQMPILSETVEQRRLEHVASWVPIVGQHAEYAGVDYDLSRTYHDRDGDPWEYVRHDSVTGNPLMNVPGLDGDEHTLAELVDVYGPLRAGAKI